MRQWCHTCVCLSLGLLSGLKGGGYVLVFAAVHPRSDRGNLLKHFLNGDDQLLNVEEFTVLCLVTGDTGSEDFDKLMKFDIGS